MSKIQSVKAREILDSRGYPTVEVEVVLKNNLKAWASVPSGASTGTHEAWELRDGDKNRYGGKGVLKAVNNVNTKIAPKIVGMDVTSQQKIDQLMIDLDGTKNKSKLGANAILGVSLAVARASAMSQNQPLYLYLRHKFWPKNKTWSMPKPMMNILNGGAHAGWSIDVQEFMIVPQQKTVKEAVRAGAEIFHILHNILKQDGYAVTVGDEGGYAPKLGSNEKALKLIGRAVKRSQYTFGSQIKVAIDIASSEFFDGSKYQMKADKKTYTSDQMIKMIDRWSKKYPIESVEDGLAEDDWSGWKMLTEKLGNEMMLVGDDLFVTSISRLKRGIDEGIGNAILIKLNQIGSVMETVNCISLAQANGYRVAISHRSGETADDFIADLAVACGAEYIKTGSLSRGERVVKYNRLMEIESEV